MTLNPEEKAALSKYRLGRANGALKDSRNLLDSGSFDASVNRSYYAILSAARAALILRGIDAESHDGVKTMFSKEFVKDGRLPKDFIETFRRVQARRIDSDYGDYTAMGKDEATDSFKRAEEFVKKVEELAAAMTREIK